MATRERLQESALEAPRTSDDPRATLSFQRAVPRALVHRASIAEVFVTDAVQTTERDFLVAAQWPRDHALYHPDALGRHDPLLFAETIRQSMVYLAHQYFDIPLDQRFIGRSMDFSVTDPDALRVRAEPLSVVLEAHWEWGQCKAPRQYGFRFDVVLTVDGRRCGHGSMDIVAVAERGYQILRNRAADEQVKSGPASDRPLLRSRPMTGDSVGRLRGKDSVLEQSEGEQEWWLRLDPDHAILFDHPSDHVPLMVTLEGFRQLGHVLTHGSASEQPGAAMPHALVSCSVDCPTFGELDQAVELVVLDHVDATSGKRLHRMAAVQGGRTLATATMLWAAQPLSAVSEGSAR